MDKQDFHGVQAASAADAFCIAAVNGKVKVMELLLSDGTDVDEVASYSGSTALCAAAGIGSLTSVAFLIEHGASLESVDKFKLTPLLNACALGKKKGNEVALLLLKAGANVHYVRPSDEMTALKFAARSCSSEVVQALIDKGASVDGPSNTEQTALIIAARNDNIEALEVLVRSGADLSYTLGE